MISQLAYDIFAAIASHPDAPESFADDRESLLTAIQNRIDKDAEKPKELRIVRSRGRLGLPSYRGPFPNSDKAQRWICDRLEADRQAGHKIDYEIFPLLSPPKGT